MNAELVKDVGGDVLLDTPQMGRPSSATVTIRNPDGTDLAASEAATIDSTNTSITANATAGATALALTSAVGITPGRYYVITATDARKEWVRVTSVDGLDITLAQELSYSYDSGNAFVGTRLTEAVSAADAATLDEGYSAEWVYETTGVTYRVNTFFDVVLAKWGDVIVTPHEFRLRAGDMASAEFEALEAEGLDFSDDILHATRLIRQECASRGFRPALFRSPGETFKDSICQRVLLTWAERGSNVPSIWQEDPQGWIELRREIFEQQLTSDLNTANFDTNEDAVVTDTERAARLGSVRIVLELKPELSR